MEQSAIWIHDSRGDRPITSAGNGTRPKLSRDGERLSYLIDPSDAASENELWEFNLKTGRDERLVSGFDITSYDLSDNRKEVLFAAKPAHGNSQVWLAPLDRRSPPVRIAGAGEDSPFFGPDGQILFRQSDGKANYLFRMNRDGSGRAKIVPHPILNVMSVSPDRRWIAVLVGVDDAQAKFAPLAIPVLGGPARRICSGFCAVRWAPDQKYLYVTIEPGRPGKTVAIPIPPGESLPDLPDSGVSSLSHALALSGFPAIDHAELAPGLNPFTYAYVRTAMHRNLFRIPIP
jgi:hypothetical protein